jgi:hypothetical protein
MEREQLSARELGLQLYSMEVSRADKIEIAFKEAIKAGSTAVAGTLFALANSNQKQIARNSRPKIDCRQYMLAEISSLAVA